MPVKENQKREVRDKKEQILLAAVEKFLEKDFYQVTITEIAEMAGVGKGTVYEYFPSKEVLFKESFSYCADLYLQLFRQHLSGSLKVKQTMHDIVTTHLDLLKDHRKKLHLLFNERPLNFQELQSWVLKSRRELLEGITGLVSKGIELGEIRGDIDVEMAGRLFLALNYVVMGGMVIMDNVEVEEERLEKLLDIYWTGIGVSG